MDKPDLVAAAAVCGAVTGLVGNLLTPRYSGDDVDIYREIAGSDRFTVSTVVVLVALLLVTVAFGLLRDLDGRHAALGCYGRLAAASGGSLALLYAALQLYGVRQEAEAFAGANRLNEVGAFWATNAVDHVAQAVFAPWTILLLGITPLLIGTGQLRGAVPGRRLAGVALAGGAVCAAVGAASLLVTDQSTLDIPFLIGSLLVTLWLLGTGVAVARAHTARPTTNGLRSSPISPSDPVSGQLV